MVTLSLFCLKLINSGDLLDLKKSQYFWLVMYKESRQIIAIAFTGFSH
jgi:hypothetical protein